MGPDEPKTCATCRYLIDARALGQGLLCNNVANGVNDRRMRVPSAVYRCSHFDAHDVLNKTK